MCNLTKTARLDKPVINESKNKKKQKHEERKNLPCAAKMKPRK